MKIPKIVRTPQMNNMITIYGAMKLCRYWSEEAEWNGDSNDAKFWGGAADEYKRQTDLGIKGWLASPVITAKMEEKGQPNFFHPYNKRHDLERWI